MKHKTGKSQRQQDYDDWDNKPKKIKSNVSEKRRWKQNLKKAIYDGELDEFEEHYD
jgi:hypothetical protein